MASYTKEQEVIVEKILRTKNNYYEILSVEKTSSDNEIKKAYRKLALKIHPDKNSHPNAPEAFKAASKAFEVLSDSSKKRIYDQTGQDPDLRSAAAAAADASGAGFSSGFAGTRPHPFATNMGGGQEFFFGNDINEDIFNIFFGGGPGGSGIHFQTFGGPQFTQRRRAPRRAPRPPSTPEEQRRESLINNFTNFLPLIIILLFSILLSLFADTDPLPLYKFKQDGPFQYPRRTPQYKVNYFITKEKFEDSNAKDLRRLDSKVEKQYVQNLNFKCTLEQKEKEEILRDAYGFFYNDEEKIKKARHYPMPNCDRLRSHGLL